MQKAHPVHHIPGRLRLKVPLAKRRAQILDKIRESIQAVPSVTRVDVNAVTGSVLVQYSASDSETFIGNLRQRGLNEGFLDIQEFDTRETNRDQMKLAGYVLLAIGAVGLALPVLPGTPFLLAGAALLGPNDPQVRRALGFFKKSRKSFQKILVPAVRAND
jgi:hypothetical protein